MTDPITIYKNFNYVEGVIWFLVAIGLPFLTKPTTNKKKLAIGIASIGFIAFGISDILEAAHQGDISVWLLVYKVVCGAVILSGRFTYIGWKKFKLTDRFFLFGLFCLIEVLGIVAVRMYFEKTVNG